MHKIIVPKHKRISSNVLTKFERTSLIGFRAEQLQYEGVEPMVKLEGKFDPMKIAEVEVDKKLLDYIIKRRMPEGKFEIWHLKELRIIK